jgi:hypothetical protein
MKKLRRTSAQVKALKAYNFILQQEERYLSSVFVTEKGRAEYDAKRDRAYQACLVVGLDETTGL